MTEIDNRAEALRYAKFAAGLYEDDSHDPGAVDEYDNVADWADAVEESNQAHAQNVTEMQAVATLAQAHALLAVADAMRGVEAPVTRSAVMPGWYTHNGVAYELAQTYVGRSRTVYRCAARTANGMPLLFDVLELVAFDHPEPYAKAFTLAYVVESDGPLTVAGAGQ